MNSTASPRIVWYLPSCGFGLQLLPSYNTVFVLDFAVGERECEYNSGLDYVIVYSWLN